jgi:hypothetical protein
MVDALESNPNIFVVLFSIDPGISEEDASSIFSKFKEDPNESLLSLATMADGLSLWWIHTRNPKFDRKRFEKARDAFKAGKLPPPDFQVSWSDGFVSINGLEYIADPSSSSELFEEPKPPKGRLLNGKRLFPEDAKKAIRNFDEYSDTQEHVTISIQPDEPSFLFLPTDQHQDFESSRKVTLESYLEFLIWSKGLKSARYDFFIPQGDASQEIESLNQAYFDALPSVDIDNLY